MISRTALTAFVKSVKKKWKDKAFAAGVNRSIIEKGAMMLDMERSDIIARTISGMREVADKIVPFAGTDRFRVHM